MNETTITIDMNPFIAQLQDERLRQVPYAIGQALNRTARDVQAAVRNAVTGRGFTVRTETSRRWLRNSIKIGPGDWASKRNHVAKIRIEPPGKGGGRAGLLGFLEEGGVRFSQFAIGQGIAFGPGSVPVPVRATPGTVVPRSLYPSMTGLQERRDISGGLTKGALRGKRRTFAIRTSTGKGIVLQRFGRGKKGRRAPGQRDPNTRVVFAITPRVRVAGRHFFFPTAERIVSARFEANMEAALQQAMSTAR